MGRAWFFGLVCSLIFGGCDSAPKNRVTPLVHSAYVWRQGWNAEAITGLKPGAIPAAITELNVVAAELGLGTPARRVHLPWAALLESQRKISLSIRVGTQATLGGPEEPALGEAFKLLKAALVEARAAGVAVESVQIDYDCPVRLLEAYADRVAEFKKDQTLPKVTVTALPSWLSAPGFRKLMATVDAWTLQVHGTARPNLAKPTSLFKASEAMRWVTQASAFKRPFRLALPTYSTLACFSTSGAYVGLKSEQAELPRGAAQGRPLSAEPEEVVALLKWLKTSEGAYVTAIDWFRLPLPGDRQNWTSVGLAKVLQGEVSARECAVTVKAAGALYDVVVTNPTEYPMFLPSVGVKWGQQALQGADATYDWKVALTPSGVSFLHDPHGGFLAPREQRRVGWLRLADEAELKLSFLKEE
jgi:hypothetical protein